MKEQYTFLENLIGMNSFDQISETPEVFFPLFEQRFKLSDLKISARVLLHWKKMGLLPEKNDFLVISDGKIVADLEDAKWERNRFNFFELIYLFIIQDLRNFGFSIQKLQFVKSQLLQKVGITEHLHLLTTDALSELKKAGRDITFLQGLLLKKDEFIKWHKEEAPDYLKNQNMLFGMIAETIFNKTDIRIIVSHHGYVSYDMVNTRGQRQFTASNYRPHIDLPLFSYLMQFLGIFKYHKLLVPYKLLTEQEKLILDHVRSGQYKEIKIKFNRRNVDRLEFTEEHKVHIAARLEDILIRGGFQEIHVTTEKGKISYCKIVTKKKIKDMS